MSEEILPEAPESQPEPEPAGSIEAPTQTVSATPAAEAVPEPAAEPAPEPAAATTPEPAAAPAPPARTDRPPREPRADRPPREPRSERPPRDRDRDRGSQQPQKGGPNDRRPGHDRRPDMRRPDGPVDIEYDKLIADSLYLDNQAHVLVARLRDLDAGTCSQLRRLYGAVRRACRAAETDRQHQFVMLRARLAYTIARHGLRSLDPLEKLLLQVTRRNETRGYGRFRDLFEAIIAYNE